MLINNPYPVRPSQRGKTVSNGKGRPSLYQPCKGLLYLILGLGIQRAGGLVKYKYLRVVEYGAGYRYALAFPAGKIVPVLPDSGVVSVILSYLHFF
jgi:hypothetical protein